MKTWADTQKQGPLKTHRLFKVISKWKIKSVLFYNYYCSTIEILPDHKTRRQVGVQQSLQHAVEQFKLVINSKINCSLSELR